MSKTPAIVAAFLLACAPALVAASPPQPVTLDAIDHTPATLVIVGGDGTEHSLTQADIEMLPTYAVRTTTPWREEPAEFSGVLLSDLLASVGLAEVGAILVTAENDFTSTLQRNVWETLPIMVATRVDGRPHTRRERGPIQFVIDADTYTNSEIAQESHLVWMAARIEAAN